MFNLLLKLFNLLLGKKKEKNEKPKMNWNTELINYPNRENTEPKVNISALNENGKVKVLMATGIHELDQSILERVDVIDNVGTALYRESVADMIQNKKPDVVLLADTLTGVMPKRELVLMLRTRFPKCRIVYLMKEKDNKQKVFLYHWMIFDVLDTRFTIKELENALIYPKSFNDIRDEMANSNYYPDDGILYDQNASDAV